MGSDMYFNPELDTRTLSEKVRDMEQHLKNTLDANKQLHEIIKIKNEEIDSLKAALRSLKQ